MKVSPAPKMPPAWDQQAAGAILPRLVEKSVIIHKDENGFGLRVKGQAPVWVEHVHENGAAWRAGIRALDLIHKVNGVPVSLMDHKDVVLAFKTCSRLVALTLISPAGPHQPAGRCQQQQQQQQPHQHHIPDGPARCWPPSAPPPPPPVTAALVYHVPASSYGSIKQPSRARASLLMNRMPSSISVSSLPSIEARSNQAQLLKKPPPALTGQRRSTNSDTPPSTPLQPQPLPPRQPHATTEVAAAKQRPVVIDKRIEIIREFIDTERAHTERLRCLNELFYRPLKQAGFMSVEQLRLVFSCHRTLYRIHRQIYRVLISANYDACSEPLIGSALLEIFEGDLKRRLERASCTFCSAQATNVELLNKLTRRDTKAGEFLAQVTSQQMIGRLGVKDLLASCFQRLTKYPLLLENLLKATPHNPPDHLEEPADQLFDGDHQDAMRRLASKRRGPQAALRCSRRPRHGRSISGDETLDAAERATDVEEGLDGAAGRADSDIDDYELSGDDADADDAERLRLARLGAAAEEARRNSRRIMAISLAEEREFIERALRQSRQILVRVNDSIKVAIARNRLKEIWKRTDKYPDVPLSSIDISKQQVVHEGLLTLRLSKRSFDVYVLLLNDYIIILTREGQDKYRLKFFTPEGKSTSFQSSAAAAGSGSSSLSSASLGTVRNILGASSAAAAGASAGSGQQLGVGANNAPNATPMNNLAAVGPHQAVYSPIFVIDEHLTTRDAATDENGFYLLCKRKDDSRIYEFSSRSPAERLKWRDKIQSAIERQMTRNSRRPSCASTLTKSSSEISANELVGSASRRCTDAGLNDTERSLIEATMNSADATRSAQTPTDRQQQQQSLTDGSNKAAAPASRPSTPTSEPTKIVGTISYVTDDGIVMPSKMESSRVLVDQAIQVNILDGSAMRG